MQSGGSLSVLLVEDNAGYARLVQELLRNHAAIRLAWVETLAAALAHLREVPVDTVLLDLGLPDSQGLDTVIRVVMAHPTLPVIVLTGQTDDALALAALNAGAQDYLRKETLDAGTLERAIRYANERKRAEEALRQLNATLEQRVRDRTVELTRAVETLEHQAIQLRTLAAELTLAEQRERERVAGVLHGDFQQLLVGAKLALSPLGEVADPAAREAGREATALLLQAIQSARSLTEELSPPIRQLGDLVAGLAWLARWMREKHHLTVLLRADELAVVESKDTAVFLFQAVRELLLNVAKHARVDTVQVEITRQDAQVRVLVADEGVGFDPTQLRLAGGPVGGFGLFSLRERLELLGGRLEIASAPGRGSRFTVWLPIYPVASEAPMISTPLAEGAAPLSVPVPGTAPSGGGIRKIRVLVVDDHAIVRQGFAQLLSGEPDLEVVGEAADGKAAVDLACELRPDVITMDIDMPVLDGLEATRQIHIMCPEVRVIGLSIFDNSAQAQAMRDAGAAAYVTKSGPIEALLAAVRGGR